MLSNPSRILNRKWTVALRFDIEDIIGDDTERTAYTATSVR